MSALVHALAMPVDEKQDMIDMQQPSLFEASVRPRLELSLAPIPFETQ